MIGPLTAVRRLTSTATGLVTSTARTGLSVASTAAHGALHLVRPGSPAATPAPEPEPTPDPMKPTVEAPVAKPTPPRRSAATKAAPRKKASEVPLKSAPTPSSAAPPVPEGPDVLPGEEGATGHAEPQPLLDASVAKQVRSESEVLRRGAE